jgi:alkanesulfonate monooxygenase SsuD/methylene tetrahydromethanopterin reductase-like flavin-dependent oxidoreductase (luciferase family)
MKIGVNLLNYGPGTTPEQLVEWARFAEDSGFAIAMISDHIAVTPEVQALYPVPFYDPFATIGWLAAHTERGHCLLDQRPPRDSDCVEVVDQVGSLV